MKKVVIIGSGFAGLSAASYMAKAGWDVTVVEKHAIPGGRARQFKAAGFTFDMGPSWYWMPDVFDRFFEDFGKNVSDYYELKRLDPSYRIYWPEDSSDIPAKYDELKSLFNTIEPGSGDKLDLFMKEACYKYQVGINKLVRKPGQSITEFADWDFIKGIFKLDVFTSIKKHISKFFSDKKLQQLLEFPVLFLGALPEDTPALYSLMNYADIKLGTFFPKGGMFNIVEGMFSLAKELGVKFYFNHNVDKIVIENNIATGVLAENMNIKSDGKHFFNGDVVIGAADYHFIETKLLDKVHQSYSDTYWKNRIMAPSCLIYYVGINKKLKDILHHTLFFDVDFEEHGKEIYKEPKWPSAPLFYVSATSVTDDSVAPEGCENLFFLVPVATGLTGDTEELRDVYFEKIMDRFEHRIGEKIKSFIIFKRSYAIKDFENDYNAFKGNAYGLANTLLQTAILKPSCRSKKIKNLFYTGQLTVPGPGVPPALISGEIVSNVVIKHF